MGFWSSVKDFFSGGSSSNTSSTSSNTSSTSSNKSSTSTSKSSSTPTFNSLTEASKAGYHGQTVNIKGKGQQKVAFADKSYDAKMAKASANVGGASQPKTGTSTKTGTTKVDTSFADDILSGKVTNVLPPTVDTSKIKITASEQKAADKAMAAYKPKTATSAITGKTITTAPRGEKVTLAPETVAKIKKASATPLTQSNDKMTTPYKGTGITSAAQKSPGYLGVTTRPANDYEKFLNTFNVQSIAAAVDPYGMSAATGAQVTPEAEAMLQSVGMTGQEYIDKVMELGRSLDDPRFGDGLVGKIIDSTMVGKGLDYLGDMGKRRAYEQLTGQYEPTMVGKLLGYGSDEAVRVVPVFGKDGNIVGSLEVDKEGKALTYTGDRSKDARPADSTITGWEDKVAPTVAETLGYESPEDKDEILDTTTTEEVIPDCPTGYIYDKTKKMCVIDPFQQPFQTAPVGTGTVVGLPSGLTPYTQVQPIQLGQLRPTVIGSIPPQSMVQPTVQPGLAGLGSIKNS